MPQWRPRLDWEHLQNWVPGVLGASAAILLVVVAANFPTRTNSVQAEAPPPQSAAVATKGQTDAPPTPSQPTVPQTSLSTDKVAKAPLPTPPPVATTGETAKPPPMHDHAMVKSEAVAASAPVQGTATLDNEPKKSLPTQQACKATLSPGDRSSRNARRVTLWSRAKPYWAQA